VTPASAVGVAAGEHISLVFAGRDLSSHFDEVPMIDSAASRKYSLRKFSLISVLLGLCLTSLTVFGAPNQSESLERAEALTQSLIGLNRAYQNAAPGARTNALDELLSVAAERHELLTSLIEENPGAVLRVAVPASVRAIMPEEIQAFIEQRVDLAGELEVMYEDYEDGGHRLRHFLKTRAERISLHIQSRPSGLVSGAAVIASGVFLDGGNVALESEDNILILAAGGEGSGGTPGELGHSIGEQATAVLMVNFLNNSDEPISVTAAHELVFDAADSFMREASSARNWLSGQVFGWYNLPIEETCIDVEISSAAQQAAAESGVDLSQYSRIIYMFPRNSNCGWSGLGTVGGATSETWINGSFDLRVVGHELGHNYGLHHAHSLECGTDIHGGNCISQEYGDKFDIMGMDYAAHFNAFNKEKLGWLDSATLDIVEVGSSGLYTLDVFENDFGTRALKIPKALDSQGRQEWYYLEYRQAVGADAFLSNYSQVTGGILVRVGTDEDMASPSPYSATIMIWIVTRYLCRRPPNRAMAPFRFKPMAIFPINRGVNFRE
jgi:hypothetical protein